MDYIYHRVPEDLQGDTLYPLNILKDKYPAIYTAAFAKYADRPILPTRRVYPLDCLWNDVLFFIPINPIKHIEFIRNLGYGRKEYSFFEVPVNRLTSTEQVCVYLSEENRSLEKDFFKYPAHRLGDFNYLPEANKNYLKEKCIQQQPIFPWNYAPHILYKGEVNISGLRILSVGGNHPPEGIYTNFNSATP